MIIIFFVDFHSCPFGFLNFSNDQIVNNREFSQFNYLKKKKKLKLKILKKNENMINLLKNMLLRRHLDPYLRAIYSKHY